MRPSRRSNRAREQSLVTAGAGTGFLNHRGKGTYMRLLTTVLLAGLIAVAFATGPATAGATAKTREFEGKVGSINRSAKTFTVRDQKRKRTFRIRVVRSTRYEDLRGFHSLRRGMKVEVTAKYSGGRWVARKIEREDRDDRDDD
jgi:hypothetical protein